MSSTTKAAIANTQGAAGAVLTLLARKEEELKAELAKIQQVRAILEVPREPSILERMNYALAPAKRRGRPKGSSKTSKRSKKP